MTPARKQRLALVFGAITAVAIAVGLVLYALNQNINLFFTPTQIASGEAPENQTIRVGGLVVAGSVDRSPDSLDVSFELTDNESQVMVSFSGILPDLFREGQGIIALGEFSEQKGFVAKEVLAKHDENYMPPEVAEALKKAGHPVKTE